MRNLLIDTSSNQSFICLCEGTTVVASQILPFGKDLSKALFPELESLLEKTNSEIKDISYIGIGTGPGSYTGTRAGASAAQSLAFSNQIPLISFCSLLAYAPEKSSSCILFMKAKNGSFFAMESFENDSLKYNLHSNLSEEAFARLTSNKNLIEARAEEAQVPNYKAIATYCNQKFLEKKNTPFNLSLFYLHTP